jgi:hypothetical protein
MDSSFVSLDIANSQSTQGTLVVIGIVFVALFGLMLWAFVSFARPIVPHAQRETGSPPVDPTIIQPPRFGSATPNAVAAPNTLPWT